MKLIKVHELNEKSIEKGMLVQDLITGKNGFIYQITPLKIKIDKGEIFFRDLKDIEFWVWDEEDIKENKEKQKIYKKIFS